MRERARVHYSTQPGGRNNPTFTCGRKDEENVAYIVYTMEYYSALKMEEVLTCTTTLVNPEDIMLSGIIH
jgi:hypothetical protein